MPVIQGRATEDFSKCPLRRSTLPRSDSAVHYKKGTPVGCRGYCDSLRRAAVSHCLSPGSARAFDPIKPITRTEPLRSCGEKTASNLRGELGARGSNEAKYSSSQGGWVFGGGGCPPPQSLTAPSPCWQRVPHRQEVIPHLRRGEEEKLDSH